MSSLQSPGSQAMPCISCGGFVSLFLSPKRTCNWFADAVLGIAGGAGRFGAQRDSRSRVSLTDTALRNGVGGRGGGGAPALQELYGLYFMLL